MFIRQLKLKNFRNYDYQEIDFNKNINIIYGNNAQGKTNIIEAIFLCAYGKSFRVKKDSDLIKFDKDKAKIDLIYERVDREGKIEVEIEGKKSFSSNGIKLNRISDVVGKINVVIFMKYQSWGI